MYFYELHRIRCIWYSLLNENITTFIALVILDSRHIAWLYNLHQLQTEAQTNHERNVGLIWNSHAVVTSWAVFASYTMKIFNNHGCGFNILIQNTHSETCVLHKVLPTEWWSHVFCSAFICSVFHSQISDIVHIRRISKKPFSKTLTASLRGTWDKQKRAVHGIIKTFTFYNHFQ